MPDPAGSGDNPYAYCGNNPVSNMDPLGLQATNGDGPSSSSLSGLAGYGIAAGATAIYVFADKIGSAIDHAFGIGGHSHHESPSKPTQGIPNVVFNLTHGPWGGGVSGVFNNALDAHTYGLPYIHALAGTDYITDIGKTTANLGLQVALGIVTEGGSFELGAARQGMSTVGEAEHLTMQMQSSIQLAQIEAGEGIPFLGAGTGEKLRVAGSVAARDGGAPED